MNLRHALLPALLCAALAGCRAPDATPIGTIQGDGVRSPLAGRTVSVEGVVGAAFGKGLGGFFMQSPPGGDDGDPATSEGLFVAWPAGSSPMPQAGDRVRARGTVAELGEGEATVTALIQPAVEIVGSGAPPAPLALRAAPRSVSEWERIEGLLVQVAPPLTVTGNANLLRFGELDAAFEGRLWTPTELAPAGPEAERIAADNARRRLLLDDGLTTQYPDALPLLPEPLSAAAPLRAGSLVHDATGVLDQRFGRYRLQLVAPPRIEQAPRPAAPEVPGALRIASFNLENLFNGDGAGGGFPTPRGAATPADLARQQAKLVAAVQGLRPDLAALGEVENDGDGADSALAQFVAALNAAGPARDWRHVAAGALAGNDAIRVAVIYRESRATPVGEPAAATGAPFDRGSRPPLAVAFRHGDGAPFVVVANHFKSKGGCPEAPDPNADQGDGQACWNALRRETAEALHAWIGGDPTRTGSDRAVILGDLNSHTQEDPLRALRALGWVDAFGDTPSHSYVWDGQAGRLDHALLSPALAPSLRGAAKWHINADEHEGFGYPRCVATDCDGPWASSDHDPLLVGLDP